MNRVALCIIALAATSAVQASSPAQDPVVFHSGNWSVHRSINQMTDATTCTGIYKNEFGIQLNDEALYLQVRAPKSYTLRFDDSPPLGLSLASDTEREINAISITGNSFATALASKRLRYSSFSVLSDITEGDLDLVGISEAHDNIVAGCPGEPLKASKSTPVSECSAKLRAKLGKKLSAADVAEVCDS